MLNSYDLVISANLSACHRCPHRQQNCAGPCACMLDGKDIILHSQAGDCPKDRHATPPSRGLGDTVAKVAKAIGAEKAADLYEHITGKDCGCAKRREKLNRLMPFPLPCNQGRGQGEGQNAG